MEMAKPEAGRRVTYSLPYEDKIYGLLYLPNSWTPEKTYPLIVEFPGNIFYTTGCYSTGRPEQCTIGYGMSKGENAIWLSLPFVADNGVEIAESGWGNPEHTADFAYRLVKRVCKEFNADEEKIVLTGFSRGAIACGFIGLRNDSIASLWKGIHACQHFDGDGWGKTKMDDALERLKRAKHIPQFHTDNNNQQPKRMFQDNGIDVVFENSGLGAHACAMFLDDRESTVKLREWFNKLLK
ncbi:hypothetical protein [Saccharicrinis sp. 156]|uniref:hypothetical protein n=2 Tax=unclassified Saccharicrinis TaxID=2646859 RepID=UPI003D329E52